LAFCDNVCVNRFALALSKQYGRSITRPCALEHMWESTVRVGGLLVT